MEFKINFYILPEKNGNNLSKSDVNLVACQLCEKAYKQNFSVFIFTNDENQTKTINELLWKFKQSSFIPHSINVDSDEPVIVSNSDPEKEYSVIINLSNKLIEKKGISKGRVLEIIGFENKNMGREKYKNYHKAGANLEIHQIE